MTDTTLGKGDFLRAISSLMTSDFKNLGRGSDDSPPITAETRLDAHGLSLDSFDRMRLARLVNEMFHVYESTTEEDLLRASRVGDWADIAASAWRRFGEKITFLTSGSTGQVKPCEHAFRSIEQEAAHFAEIFGDRNRVVALVPVIRRPC